MLVRVIFLPNITGYGLPALVVGFANIKHPIDHIFKFAWLCCGLWVLFVILLGNHFLIFLSLVLMEITGLVWIDAMYRICLLFRRNKDGKMGKKLIQIRRMHACLSLFCFKFFWLWFIVFSMPLLVALVDL